MPCEEMILETEIMHLGLYLKSINLQVLTSISFTTFPIHSFISMKFCPFSI